MKILINELEKNLGFKIRKNVWCVGIDTATTSGVAIINIDNEIVDIDTKILKIPSIPKDTEDKAEHYEQSMEALLLIIRDFKKELKSKKISKSSMLVLENSYLGVNPYTFGYLKAYFGILFSELYDLFKEIKIVFASTARKGIGFKSNLPKGSKSKDKKEEIINYVSKILKTKITDDNIADALVLCFYALKI